ncbi:YkgJ family cysteine cluster protein [Myxococcota bacterium]|nr:YkgJ family cysteine cluster protein [Myxococcota bacterium]MBU1533743.1 YkgJ family cysteine cluster protein [Myxococcota bacterium]
MTKLMLSVEQLTSRASLRKAVHRVLAKTLKNKPPKDLDHDVHRWNDEIFAEINCLDCGNCCRTMDRHLTTGDIDKLARFLRMKLPDFVDQYLLLDSDEDYVFKETPCPFFDDDNTCLVYEARPRSCREYPYLHVTKFYQMLALSLKNRETCPAVFHVFERLNEKYGK